MAKLIRTDPKKRSGFQFCCRLFTVNLPILIVAKAKSNFPLKPERHHFLQESRFFHTSFSTFLYIKFFVTGRVTTNTAGNLEDDVFILVKNDLIFSSLSTQHLFSLDPCFFYLDITTNIKGASPIYLFNLYVLSIYSSSFEIRPQSFSPPFVLPLSLSIFIFGTFRCHHTSCDSYKS